MENKIEVTHPNGYKGVLYGRSSLSILKDDKEVLHTGFTRIKTEKDLYDILEGFPKFNKMVDEVTEKFLKRKEVEKDK